MPSVAVHLALMDPVVVARARRAPRDGPEGATVTGRDLALEDPVAPGPLGGRPLAGVRSDPSAQGFPAHTAGVRFTA